MTPRRLPALALAAWPLLLARAGLAGEPPLPKSYLSDQPLPIRLYDFPARPHPILELGDPFLGPGDIRKPVTLPGGAVWSPAFMVFGTLRSAVQTFDDGTHPRVSEWANRLDVYGNLRLSPTERVLVGLRPFDEFVGSANRFSGYVFEPGSQRGWNEAFRAAPTTLFFEAELGEIFPKLDKHDTRSLDYGFSVGRQPLTLQDGILASDDSIDLVGITRDMLEVPWASKVKLSALFGWSQIDRGDSTRDAGAQLYGLTSYADFNVSTLEADAVYVRSLRDAESFNAGLGAIQRLGEFATTFRANLSAAPTLKTPKAQNGGLLTAEINHPTGHDDDFYYLDVFWGIERFTSADRAPTAGGPLGRMGILYSTVALGQYGSPLSNQAQRAVGGALGWETFFFDPALKRRQLVLEAGARGSTATPHAPNEHQQAGAAARYQQAFGRHVIAIVDAFAAWRKLASMSNGGRFELAVKF